MKKYLFLFFFFFFGVYQANASGPTTFYDDTRRFTYTGGFMYIYDLNDTLLTSFDLDDTATGDPRTFYIQKHDDYVFFLTDFPSGNRGLAYLIDNSNTRSLYGGGNITLNSNYAVNPTATGGLYFKFSTTPCYVKMYDSNGALDNAGYSLTYCNSSVNIGGYTKSMIDGINSYGEGITIEPPIQPPIQYTQTGSGDPYISGCIFNGLDDVSYTTCSNLDTNLLTGSYLFSFLSPDNISFTGSVSIDFAKSKMWGGYIQIKGDVFSDNDTADYFATGGIYNGSLYFDSPYFGLNLIQNFDVNSVYTASGITIDIGVPTDGNYITYCNFINTYDIFSTKCNGLSTNLKGQYLFYKFTNSTGSTYTSDIFSINSLINKGYIYSKGTSLWPASYYYWPIYDVNGGIDVSGTGSNLLSFFTESGSYLGQLFISSNSGGTNPVEIQSFQVSSIGHTQLPIPQLNQANTGFSNKFKTYCSLDVNNDGEVGVLSGEFLKGIYNCTIAGVEAIGEGIDKLFELSDVVNDIGNTQTRSWTSFIFGIEKANATGIAEMLNSGIEGKDDIYTRIPKYIMYGIYLAIIIVGLLFVSLKLKK